MTEQPSNQTIYAGLLSWPGKSADAAGIEAPAVLHMLDVAAVAEVLAVRLPVSLRPLFVLFAALHDPGKINAAFRAMLRDGVPQDNGRHWEVRETLLAHHDNLLAARLGSSVHVRAQVYDACAEHLGQPPPCAGGKCGRGHDRPGLAGGYAGESGHAGDKCAAAPVRAAVQTADRR